MDTEIKKKKKWLTACLSSRTLAQYSTDRYAGGLYCRVRNGTGCDPAAMAVIPIPAISYYYLKITTIMLIACPSMNVLDCIGGI